MGRTYHGYRCLELGPDGVPLSHRCVVVVRGGDDDKEGRLLDPRLDLRSHSPGGFEWGHGGCRGAAQLALALVADAAGQELAVSRVYQWVKRAIVATLPHDGWTLTQDQILAVVGEATEGIDP